MACGNSAAGAAGADVGDTLCLGRDGVCAEFHIMHLQRLCSRDSNTIHIVIIIITSINSDLCVARGCHGCRVPLQRRMRGSACPATGGSVASLNYAVGECVPVRLPLAVQRLVRAVSRAHHHQQHASRVFGALGGVCFVQTIVPPTSPTLRTSTLNISHTRHVKSTVACSGGGACGGGGLAQSLLTYLQKCTRTRCGVASRNLRVVTAAREHGFRTALCVVTACSFLVAWAIWMLR